MKALYKLLFLLAIIEICFSCEKNLMEVPLSSLAPENFYDTEEKGITSINACYQSLKDNFISLGQGVFVYLDNSTDFNLGNERNFGDFYNNSVSSSNTDIILWWERTYETIGACNITIGRIEASDIDGQIKNRILGEARFLRALNYFHIVRIWGPAPLKTTIPLASDNMDLPRASIEDIYNVIVADLKFAEENCWGVGETREIGGVSYSNDIGRATVGAAKALLADVYLKIASTANAAQRRTDPPLVNNNTGQVDGLEAYKMFDSEAYYDSCIQKCNEVEGLGYVLNTNFMTNFDTKKKNGVESIFEIQAFGQLEYGSRLAPFYSPAYSGLYGGTWGGTHGVSQTFLLNKGPFKIYKIAQYNYRPAVAGDASNKVTNFQFDLTDYRYENGFIHLYYDNNKQREYTWDAGTAKYIGKPAGAITKFHTSKYIDTEGTIADDNSNNWIMLRFADILLMKAECLFEREDWDGAWELIKRVHTRDGNQNLEEGNVFPDSYADWIARFDGNSDAEKFREAILYERMIELVYEGHRFYDLCRMGKLEEKCAVVGRTRTRKAYYFPISQTEINANEAISEQDNNPGYETQVP